MDTYVPPMDSGSSRAVDAGRATPDVPSTVDAGAPQNKDDVAVGPWSCEFTNPFSKADECRDYSGTWMKSDIEADCAAVFTSVKGKLFNSACDTSGAFGYCAIEAIGGAKILNFYYAGDQAMTAQVCTGQLKGLWFPLTNDDNDAGNTSEGDAGNTNESDAASDKGADDAGGTDNGNTDAGKQARATLALETQARATLEELTGHTSRRANVVTLK